MQLPAEFLSRMRGMLGKDFDVFVKSYESPAQRAIRVNTLKIPVEKFKRISPFSLEQVPWENSGFYVSAEGLGKTVYHAAGLYYVQEPSAMCAAPMLEAKGGERVLDLCSAPGGKGSQLAQYLEGEAEGDAGLLGDPLGVHPPALPGQAGNDAHGVVRFQGDVHSGPPSVGIYTG